MLGRIRAKQGVGEQILFVPKTVWGSGWSQNPMKNFNFYPHLSLETVSPAFKLIQNCYINMNIYFF